MKKIIRYAIFSILIVSTSCNATPAKSELSKLGHWLIHVRLLVVRPNPSSTTISVIGGNVTRISTQTVPELDISYFFVPHFAAELILATNRHSITAQGTALGEVPLGRITLLPPTLTFQYHFTPLATFDPYFGLGINYTFFYDASPRTVATIKYTDNPGFAVQFGANYYITRHWVANVDVKKLFLSTTVTTTNPTLRTVAHIDPYIVGVGFGYHF